ncbi:hypothetical protein G7054_g507 [Neopestalotiopsis clavispora]|nr:hypothetical protein G7054_g507 [Neopestalotiopsis clavispora]
MDHSEDPGTVCTGTEEPAISNRSMHRRVKQREGRARRRAARRENRSDAKDEYGSSIDLSSGGVAAVASDMADSSPTIRQSMIPDSKDVSTKVRIRKGNKNNQISQDNCRKSKVPDGQTTMHHQGTEPPVAGTLRCRPNPAQRNMRFFRELFESDTRPSDWDLVCEMRGQHAEFPHTDQPVPVGRISALWWEKEYLAADIIDRPLRGFKEVKKLHVDKTKEIAFFKRKLAKAERMHNRVMRNCVRRSCRDEESVQDYRSLRYAKFLLAYLIPMLEVQQTILCDLMEAIGKAYSQLKACKRLYKQQRELRESIEQLKQIQLELRKQIQEEHQGGQRRTDYWISEWKRAQVVLKEKKKSLISEEDFWRLPERHDISRQAYELLLRDQTAKTGLCCVQTAYPTYNDLPDAGF